MLDNHVLEKVKIIKERLLQELAEIKDRMGVLRDLRKNRTHEEVEEADRIEKRSRWIESQLPFIENRISNIEKRLADG
jgi:ElaB/YqjD/DUF883 family membrane-anchored ribosome-binding protein